MNLTSAEEEKIISKYKARIFGFLNRYLKPSGNPLITRDDAFQECAIVLLQRIRKMDSITDLDSDFPYLDMKRAVQRLIIRSQRLRYPEDTSKIMEIIRREEATGERAIVESLDQDIAGDDRIENATFLIDFERFLETLSQMERKIVLLKINGARNREIAKELCSNDYTVSRMIGRIREKYIKYAAI